MTAKNPLLGQVESLPPASNVVTAANTLVPIPTNFATVWSLSARPQGFWIYEQVTEFSYALGREHTLLDRPTNFTVLVIGFYRVNRDRGRADQYFSL